MYDHMETVGYERMALRIIRVFEASTHLLFFEKRIGKCANNNEEKGM